MWIWKFKTTSRVVGQEMNTKGDAGSLQHEFDLALDDLHKRQDEIKFRLNQETQTFVLMLGAVTAVVGSQLLFQANADFAKILHTHPWLIILVSCILLWFPITNVIAWADIGIAAAYINQVAVPRLRVLIEIERENLLSPGLKNAVRKKEDAALGRWALHESWERYRAEHFYQQRRRYMLFPLWIFRTLLLFTPSGLSLYYYIDIRSSKLPVGLTWADVAISATYGVLLITIIAALLTSSNLPRSHSEHPDPDFKEDPRNQ